MAGDLHPVQLPSIIGRLLERLFLSLQYASTCIPPPAVSDSLCRWAFPRVYVCSIGLCVHYPECEVAIESVAIDADMSSTMTIYR